MNSRSFDVIILGAGAAGLFCAKAVAQRGRRVLVLEHNTQVGRKILISGGGRCNFTNTEATPSNFDCQNPHFVKSALSRFTPWDFIDLLEKHGIPYFEKKSGQQFCKRSARDIVGLLLEELDKGLVKIEKGIKIGRIEKNGHFTVILEDGRSLESESLVVATGGLSIPSIGASDLGYKIARQFGHKVVNTLPALVPFTLSEDLLECTRELSGVSHDVLIKSGQSSFRESLLFTHKGLSGPAVLQASLYWKHGEEIVIDFLPDLDIDEVSVKQKNGHMNLVQFFKNHFAKRFLGVWMELNEIPTDKKIGEIENSDLKKALAAFKEYRVIPSGTEGYRKAEVTKGGVATDKISSKSLESQLEKGLFFIGECLDVTGQLGGFNFQWAWASASAAGQFA